MNLRSLMKSGEHHARRARVAALALPRALPWLRRELHLPPNAVLDAPEAASAAGVRITALDRPESFQRPLPLFGAGDIGSEFFEQRRADDGDGSYVAEMDGGSFWGAAEGAVFAPDGRFMPAFTRDPWGPRLHSVWSRARLPRPELLPGRTLYLVTPEATDNYHHWVIDLLPRIGLVQRAGYDPASFDRVVVNHSGRAYQLESLERLGIARAKVVSATRALHSRAESLVVPSLKRHNQGVSSADLAFLRSRFIGDDPPRPGGRRLYLSRRGASFRRLLNEPEILSVLAEHRFEVVSPGDLDFGAQARLFSEAGWVLGVSGAAFANLAFASRPAEVVEIAPPQWLSVYHWMISARLGLPHTILLGDGTAAGGRPEITGRRRDVTLAPRKLAALLARGPLSGVPAPAL